MEYARHRPETWIALGVGVVLLLVPLLPPGSAAGPSLPYFGSSARIGAYPSGRTMLIQPPTRIVPTAASGCATNVTYGQGAAPAPIVSGPNASFSGDVGYPIQFTVLGHPVGSPAGYCWSAVYNNGGSEHGQLAAENGTQADFTFPSVAGQFDTNTYYVELRASGPKGDFLWYSQVFVQTALDVQPSITPNPGDAGSPIAFTADNPDYGGLARSGTPPYSYRWAFGDGVQLSTGKGWHAYPADGSYTAELEVTDSAGMSNFRNLSVTVGPALRSAYHGSSGRVDLNAPIGFSTATSGGHPPYSYRYDGLPPGCVTSNSSAFSCVPSQTGTFPVTITVTDVWGGWANQSVNLTVVVAEAGSSPGSFAFTLSFVLILGFAVAITSVVAGVAWWYARPGRRRGGDRA